jgi:DNA-binding beta-propeller fold protein YncE
MFSILFIYFSLSGHVTTLAGTGVAGFVDGPGNVARFSDPEGIAVNEIDGSVLVVDKGNNRVRKISADGTQGRRNTERGHSE